MEKIRVHIADDHKVLIDGIKAVLKIDTNIEFVGSSLNGKDVVDWFKNNIADVLILDINMPKLDGFEVLKELQDLNIQTKTVVLSSYDDVKIVKEALKLGAKGFIAKNAAAEQIIEAIKDVYAGKQFFSTNIREKIVNSFFIDEEVIQTEEVTTKNSEYSDQMLLQMLTERERDVLQLVAKEYNTKEISDQLNIATSTVETHRRSLIKKLNVKNSVGLALFAMKNKII